ncbi:MAG: hypothetical protein K8S14_07650 [Actinomycetia bacterium]|nr:hypothetical protein [Actinomycetes bacterium]
MIDLKTGATSLRKTYTPLCKNNAHRVTANALMIVVIILAVTLRELSMKKKEEGVQEFRSLVV